ncbi:hypothetical protein ACJX0J_012718, partial [Zea mays]
TRTYISILILNILNSKIISDKIYQVRPSKILTIRPMNYLYIYRIEEYIFANKHHKDISKLSIHFLTNVHAYVYLTFDLVAYVCIYSNHNIIFLCIFLYSG